MRQSGKVLEEIASMSESTAQQVALRHHQADSLRALVADLKSEGAA